MRVGDSVHCRGGTHTPAVHALVRRIRAQVYGSDDRLAMVDTAIERLDALVEYMRAMASAGHRAWTQHIGMATMRCMSVTSSTCGSTSVVWPVGT